MLSRMTPYPGWRLRFDGVIVRHEPKLFARIVKAITGRYPGEREAPNRPTITRKETANADTLASRGADRPGLACGDAAADRAPLAADGGKAEDAV